MSRRFDLVRDVDVTGISGTGRVAEGVEFTDGTVVLRWLQAGTARPDKVRPTTVLHENWQSVEALHSHDGRTRIEWQDPGMSEISNARARLHAQLELYTAGLLEAERVHLYAPTIVATPCVWIGQPGVTSQMQGNPGTRLRIVRFGVYTLADGYDPEQCELLDELVARVWDAANAVKFANPIVSVPQAIDIGGTSQRGVVTDVGITTSASSMCVRPASANLIPALA